MAEAARLIATIKNELKSQGLTYRDVARALRLSEASVKRMFASGRFAIDRLIDLGGLLGLTLAELAHMAAADVPRVSQTDRGTGTGADCRQFAAAGRGMRPESLDATADRGDLPPQ